MRSMLGFRYPLTNGSSRVSNKGFRHPNGPCIILIKRTNKFGIDMPIISATKNIRGVSWSGKVIGNGTTPLGHSTLNGLFHLFLRLHPFLHKGDFLRRRRGLALLLFVLPLLVLLL